MHGKNEDSRSLHLDPPILHPALPNALKSPGYDIRRVVQLGLCIPPRRLGLCGPLIRHLPEEPALGVGPGDVQRTFRGGEGGDDVGAFGHGFTRGFLGVFQGCALEGSGRTR